MRWILRVKSLSGVKQRVSVFYILQFSFQLAWNEVTVGFLLLPKCFFPPPHQKALNQFHALQMLFTLLGVKHLPARSHWLLELPLLSLFLSLALFFSLRLYKEACRSSGPLWKWSIAHNVPSRKGGCGVFISCIHWWGTQPQSIVNSNCSIFWAAVFPLNSAIP